jgi:hypothetical protein
VQKLANTTGRDAFDQRDRPHLESEPPEKLDVALAPLPEAEGLCRDHHPRAKRLKNLPNELLRLPPGQLGRELQNEQLVGPDFPDQLDAALEGRDQLDVIAQHSAGVRVEGDDRRAKTSADCLFDRRAVASMDTVERADRDRALGRVELRRGANDLQIASSGRSRSLGTGEGMSQRTPASAPTVVIQSAGRNPSAAPSPPPASDPSGRMP